LALFRRKVLGLRVGFVHFSGFRECWGSPSWAGAPSKLDQNPRGLVPNVPKKGDGVWHRMDTANHRMPVLYAQALTDNRVEALRDYHRACGLP
jgi:hypothetical protein